jgi:LacI family gluconate utilization system Gnt-I transcriptional repressor
MNAGRSEIGTKAAEIIAERVADPTKEVERIVELSPKVLYGDTLKRR